MNDKSLLRVSPIKNWLSFFLPLACLGGLAIVFIGQSQIDARIERLKFEQITAMRLRSASLASEIAVAVMHLASLTRERPILAALDNPQSAELEDVADAFTSLILRNPGYDQVRWIDEAGMERVRLNVIDGKPSPVPANELQSKVGRDYFTGTMKLNPGRFCFSRPDLNVERGSIEIPKKRMLLLATPGVDSAGLPRGMLIINLHMSHLQDNFIRTVDFAALQILLLDQQGVWLERSNPDGEEGFFMDDNGLTFAVSHQSAWERIVKQDRGIFFADDGLWIWQQAPAQIPGSEVQLQKSLWIVLAHVSADLRSIEAAHWRQLATVFLIGLVIVGAISW